MPAFARAAFSVAAFSELAFSFDGEGPTPPADVVAATPPPSGGAPATLRVRARTRREIEEARERFGIPPKVRAVIASVAARQAETLEADEQKRFEELTRELALERIEFEAHHLEALNAQRQKLIDTEIGLRLQRLRDDEEVRLLLLLAAAIA